MKKLVLVLPLIALVCVACSGVDHGDVVVPVSERVPDLTGESRGLTTKFYDSDNAHTKEVLAKLENNPAVRAELTRFGAEGYQLSPEHSFVTEGADRTGGHVEIAVLTLANPSDARNAVNLFCIGGAMTTNIAAFRLTFDESVSKIAGYERIGDGAWWRLIEPSAGLAASAPNPDINWNWKRWGKCMGDGLAQGAKVCSIVCIPFGPPGYFKCVVVCTGIRTAAALVQCTMAEL